MAFGTFNAGIGIMPQQPESFYDEAQRKINSTIRKILDIRLGPDKKHLAQNILLRMTDVFPFHLQHQRMGLLTLNRIIKNKTPKILFNAINEHLDKPDGWPQAADERKTAWLLNGDGPKIKIQTEQTMASNPIMLRKVFPMNMHKWFNELPAHIRLALGTNEFDKLVISHLKGKCFHPIKKKQDDCKFCRNEIIHNLNQEDLIKKIKLNYNTLTKSPREIDSQITEDLSNLSNLVSLWFIKMFLNNDVVVDGQNWSEEESMETDSNDSSIFMFSECR